MSQLLLQVLIVVAFGALCFGFGYLTAFIVTRNKWRDEMIKRGVARYNWQTGKWEWGEQPSVPPTNDPPAGSPESMRAMLAKMRG
jgi:hypothetical protein